MSMNLVERIIEETKDKDAEYIVKRGVPALEGLFSGLKEGEKKIFSNKLRKSLINENATGMPDFTCIVPLVFFRGHNFETEKVKSLISVHDKSSQDKYVMEADLALYSIVFDLFYGNSFDAALDNATELSEESFSKKVNFRQTPDTMHIDEMHPAYQYLFRILNQYSNSESATDAIALFMRGVVSMKETEIEDVYKESIRLYISKCRKNLS